MRYILYNSIQEDEFHLRMISTYPSAEKLITSDYILKSMQF